MSIRLSACLAVGVTLVSLGFSVGRAQDVGKKDRDSLQGVWQAVFAAEGDRQAMPEQLKAWKRTVKGNKMSVPGRDGWEGIFELDASKKPKAMDLTFLTGNDKGKTLLVIYALGAWGHFTQSHPVLTVRSKFVLCTHSPAALDSA